MKYNILPNSQYESNIILGNREVLFGDLYKLVYYDDIPVIELNAGDVVVFDFDLGNRTHLDNVYYKFNSSHPAQEVKDSITFSYKNEYGDTTFIDLTTRTTESGVYYSTLSGSVFAPRHLRIKQDLTSISGTLYGFQALTNDSIVNFGETGADTEVNLEAVRDSSITITPIKIFNSGPHTADAILSIEPTYTDVDEAIAIGTTENGPWSYARGKDVVIADKDADTYNFDAGLYSNTFKTPGNTLKITRFLDENSKETFKDEVGIYYSRIFYDDLEQMKLFIENISTGGSIAVDDSDTLETIEIRSSNEEPPSYSILRYPYYGISSSYIDFYLRTLFVSNFSVAYNSSSFYRFYIDSGSMNNYEAVLSKNSDRTIGWITTYSASSGSYTKLFLYNVNGATVYTNTLATHNTNSANISCNIYNIKLTDGGGTWVYFYCESYNSGDFVNKTGYYLCYFNSSLSNILKIYDTTKKYDYMGVDFYSNYLWVIRRSSKAIYKMDTTGTTLSSFELADQGITDNPGSLFVLENDNGVWFSNGGDLHKLDKDATTILDSIEGVVDSDILHISIDISDSNKMWITWGNYIGLFNIGGPSRGEMDFYVLLPNIVAIDPIYSGCWARTINLSSPDSDAYKLISKVNKRVDKSYSPSGSSKPFPKEILYSDPSYTGLMSALPSNTWTNLEWSKIYPSDYLFSEEAYHQLKLTLRLKKASELYSGESSFIYIDDFNQTSASPRDVLWGGWRDKTVDDGLNRVYIDTVNSELVLTPQWGGSLDAYINTANRLIVKKDSSGFLDVRISYRIGNGNVYPTGTGRDENLYITAYSLESSHALNAHIYMHPTLSSNASAVRQYSTYNNNDRYLALPNPQLAYEGTLRLYMTSAQSSYDTSYGYVWYNNNWYNTSGNSNAVGEHYYFQISTNRESSQIQITKFEVVSGECYYYTESPEIESIYAKQRTVLKDIYPNNYKEAYLRTQASSNLSIPSNSETNLKVRWEVPVA